MHLPPCRYRFNALLYLSMRNNRPVVSQSQAELLQEITYRGNGSPTALIGNPTRFSEPMPYLEMLRKVAGMNCSNFWQDWARKYCSHDDSGIPARFSLILVTVIKPPPVIQRLQLESDKLRPYEVAKEWNSNKFSARSVAVTVIRVWRLWDFWLVSYPVAALAWSAFYRDCLDKPPHLVRSRSSRL